MKQYFLLQLKRLLKVAPIVVILSLALAVGFGLVLNAVSATDAESAGKQAKVAITGEMEDTLLSMGIAAISDIDALSYSIDVVQTDTESAKKMLEQGYIAAYVEIPEGFAEKAAYGEFMQLSFVTTPGATGLVPMIKQEITQMVSTLLTYSHKGVYGVADALNANGQHASGALLTDASFAYADFILNRSEIYRVENLGVAYSLTLSGYFFCGLFTVLLFLSGIACCHLFVRKDTSLGRLLAARGISAKNQLAGEFFAYSLLMWLVASLIIAAAYATGILASALPVTSDFTILQLIAVLIKIIPAILLICGFHFVVYEIATEPVSAVLFQFLFAAMLGYASGCIFPIWFFPAFVGKIAPFTPTGAARGYISACFNGENFLMYLAVCIAFFALFAATTLFVRQSRIVGRKEGVV